MNKIYLGLMAFFAVSNAAFADEHACLDKDTLAQLVSGTATLSPSLVPYGHEYRDYGVNQLTTIISAGVVIASEFKSDFIWLGSSAYVLLVYHGKMPTVFKFRTNYRHELDSKYFSITMATGHYYRDASGGSTIASLKHELGEYVLLSDLVCNDDVPVNYYD